MNQTTREALELASRDCRATVPVTIEHLMALKRLEKKGLVRHIRTKMSAFYRITKAGKQELAKR